MNHLWKSRTFRKTFFSYVIILGIPMIIFSILYLYTTIQEEQEKIYASYTRDAYRIAKAIDDKMMELKHLGNRISKKGWVKKRAIQADIYQNEFDVFKQQEMKEELRNAISESGILSFGVIIYPEK
ncbi:MAG: AraC family transcriptional regulator, partial [Epulopiscium sp.]|nr:AraC family transcriptional regulator [Candidatus Epulonipiscium sp.]